ncbi:MAG: sirohydrochlorin chelatase [Chloroflexota bacterium]
MHGAGGTTEGENDPANPSESLSYFQVTTKSMQDTATAKRVLLLIGHGSRDEAAIAEYNQFAASLEQHLSIPVQSCFLEFADPPIARGIQSAVELHGATEVIALPLFLGAGGHQKNDVPAIINWAKARYPQVTFRYGTPIGTHYGIVQTLAARAEEMLAFADVEPSETALLLVGRGSSDPDSNSEVYKMARMLWEGREYSWVESCFYALTKPDISTGIARCVQLGARHIVVLPYLLFTGFILRRTAAQVEAAKTQYPNLSIQVAGHLSTHQAVIEAVAQRYEEATQGLAAMSCDLCKYRHRFAGYEQEFGLPQNSDHHHGLRGLPNGGHGAYNDLPPELEAKLAQILPPRYQESATGDGNGNGTRVSAAPMAGADLKFGQDGSVAWGEMWEDFCDLALAGGPSHRSELLEPVDPQLAKLNPSGYEAVLNELARGLELVTELETVESRSQGWIGLTCHSEEMAIWLLRAIVVENIFARREGHILYFPAGPHFQLGDEIKSIITVAAKTHHYWTEHLAGQQLAEQETTNAAVRVSMINGAEEDIGQLGVGLTDDVTTENGVVSAGEVSSV